jgi:hypothetical protein
MTPIQWLLGNDSGVSSQTILLVMTETPEVDGFDPDVPHDPSDLGRCVRLLDHFPDWRPRLPEMAARYPDWAPFVRDWEALEAEYRRVVDRRRKHAPALYAHIRSLVAEGRTERRASVG